MNLSFLRNFLIIVDSGSLAEAARRLNLAPTTLAQQVHSIEKDLGVKLLARTGRTLSLTEPGHRVLEQARVLVKEYMELRASVKDRKSTRLNSSHVAISYAVFCL